MITLDDNTPVIIEWHNNDGTRGNLITWFYAARRARFVNPSLSIFEIDPALIKSAAAAIKRTIK